MKVRAASTSNFIDDCASNLRAKWLKTERLQSILRLYRELTSLLNSILLTVSNPDNDTVPAKSSSRRQTHGLNFSLQLEYMVYGKTWSTDGSLLEKIVQSEVVLYV
jgi:hypothetical protein